jgi:hypothetical protein
MATPPNPSEISHASTPELFSGVVSDVKELAAGHFDRMRGEFGDEFKNLKRMMMMSAVSAGVVVVGAVLVGHTLAYGLAALGLPVWAGYALASALMIAAGMIVRKRLPADNKDADLVPEESLAKLESDMRQVRHAVQAH